MDHFTVIDEGALDALGHNDRIWYGGTIKKYGVWGHLVTENVALQGHFVFTSGGHGNVYINIRDLKTIQQMAPVAMQMAWECREQKCDAIVGTPHGADTLAVLVSYYYTQFTDMEIEVLKPLKSDHGLVWYKDHGERVLGMRILQVEDVINTAKSLRETADHIISWGGQLCGVIAVCNRISEKNPGFKALQNEYDIDFVKALADVEAVNFAVDITQDPAEQCTLCQTGICINTRVGHGKKFLEQIRERYPQLWTCLQDQNASERVNV